MPPNLTLLLQEFLAPFSYRNHAKRQLSLNLLLYAVVDLEHQIKHLHGLLQLDNAQIHFPNLFFHQLFSKGLPLYEVIVPYELEDLILRNKPFFDWHLSVNVSIL